MVDDFSQLLSIELELVQRRLRGMAMISRGIVPDLVVSQRVIDRITKAAQQYIEDETGEAMVGAVIAGDEQPESMPTIYVFDTISPDETAVRRSHTFQQGDELQQDIFVWLYENWEAFRQLRIDHDGRPLPPQFDTPLAHVGDWHKQPGYMIQPSGGDLMTALAILDDPENGFEFLLVPIVTLGHPATTLEDDADVNYNTVLMEDGMNLRIDWWYIHRDIRFFQPVTPHIVPSLNLPTLSPYPWHLLDDDRLSDEVMRMNQAGLFVSVVVWEADGDLPLEICFMCARQGSDRVILVTTDWNYPKAIPKAYVAPFLRFETGSDMYQVFAQLWDNSEPVPLEMAWNNDTRLVDFVRAAEESLGIEATMPPEPVAEVTEEQDKLVDESVDQVEDVSDDMPILSEIPAAEEGDD